ncbi:MAG: hypothetical protein B7Y45_04545 [Sphingomonas sp. 28-66-16]|nr:MAG: hypothetical protein B7Y45_04545 [Sphingomonas sp. 28-66-16]
MFGRIALIVAGVLWSAGRAEAQALVTSAGPDSVSVTVYRAPNRETGSPIDRQRPEGYALITETRTVTLPAGRSVIRFEGVAGNIFPESAIIGGLPAGVRERNLDADLLSPRSLFDRALGRRVMIRRTDKATGKVVEQQAVIRSGTGGAAVIQTGDGYEGYQCSGMPEALVYPGVPAGLSAKPTLSVETDSDRALTATVTLSYLAGGFDWQANYIVTMRPGGASADLFAWVTMASADVTSFVAAGAQVVAGKPNRVDDAAAFGPDAAQSLTLQCWPSGPPAFAYDTGAPPPPPPPPMAYAPMAMRAEAMDIVVTGSQRKAVQEDLGDLKLYRITDPVTVASQSQKQVALLAKNAVPVTIVYVSDAPAGSLADPVLTVRARNRADAGLGVPLPSGQVAVFENAAGRPILLGESTTADKAVGEDVEVALAATPAVHARSETIAQSDRTARYRLIVTNANPHPIAYEAKLRVDDAGVLQGRGITRKDGVSRWQVQVPANGTATLDYSVTRPAR